MYILFVRKYSFYLYSRWILHQICSILNGEKLLAPPSNLWITKNSLFQPNGHQYYATPTQVQSILTHIQTYKSPYKDIRPQIRRIEQKFLHEYDGLLIGNQCLDFGKQDGVTEIEESIMANSVERKLNDLLLEDEIAGKVVVNRQPIFVSCVSNFTNFLDLFRKTLRSLELGIPCVVLGRSHTVQHSYRWTELLVELMKEEELDLGMVTYLSAQVSCDGPFPLNEDIMQLIIVSNGIIAGRHQVRHKRVYKRSRNVVHYVFKTIGKGY